MITDILLGLILAAGLLSTAFALFTRIDALRDDIADVERLVRRVVDDLDLDED